ncbi:MAG: YeeE/YedE family protein [Deltaproteobacteria bacterium]|nr:YeeE/YedE family protein [Deltaproteobacteria bacterium]
MTGKLNWFTGGIALGVVFLLAVFFVKPIGVSTQFVVFDGIVWNALSDDLIVKSPDAKSGYTSKNVYLNKGGGKYAKNVMNPLNYSFIFVLCMFLGAVVSSRTKGPQATAADRIAPAVWRSRFGNGGLNRYVVSFVGGVLVLFGARLAGGCMAGHTMSGIMQTSISGYMFALGIFVVGIPLTIMLYGRK